MRAATDGNLPDDIEQLKAAIQLCADDEVFFIHRGENGTIIPCLLLNDTFYYACADLEEIDWGQVVGLRDRIRANVWPEAIRWAQEEGREHFRMLPIPPVQESMSKWDKMQTCIRSLEVVLKGIAQWDMMDLATDGPYWRGLIANVLRNE